MNHSNRSAVLTVVIVLSMFTAACSSSKSSTSSGTTVPAKSAALSGAPVKIGWMSIEGSLGIDFSPERKVAQAAIDDLNAKGGMGGHPVQLVTCITQASSGGADCANQMVQQKVDIVMSFGTNDSTPIYPILKAGGVPLIGSGASPLNAADLTPDGNHFFITAGALALYLTSNPVIANTLKAKSVGVVVGSASAAQQAATKFVKGPLEALGVKVQLASVSESNPDYTAAINTVSGNDVLMGLVDCKAQNNVVKQAVTLGYKGKILACSGTADVQAMGSAAANVYSSSQVTPANDPEFANQPDVKAFLAFAQKYKLELSTFNEQAYALVETAKYAVNAAGGPSATGTQVSDALRSSSHWPIPLVSSAGVSCSTVQSKVVPTACNVDTMFVQIQPDLKTVRAFTGFVQAPGS